VSESMSAFGFDSSVNESCFLPSLHGAMIPNVDIDPPVRSRKSCEFKMLNAKVLDANRKML
jgi:hypothetical protein